MEDCLFCKIANGEIETSFVYEDEQVVVFNDISPHAPVHLLVVPKKHIASLDAIKSEDSLLIGHIFQVIGEQMRLRGFNQFQEGYRVVSNMGEKGGQTVGHIHFHILAGRNLQWPPG